MTDDQLAMAFKGLSHPRRMRIFRTLVDDPRAGDSLQYLQARTAMPTACFTHHLREMERVGLIRKRRKGAIVATRLTPGPLTTAIATALSMADRHLRRPEIAA